MIAGRSTWRSQRSVRRRSTGSSPLRPWFASVRLRSATRCASSGWWCSVEVCGRLRDHPWDHRCTTRAALALVGPGAAVGLRSAAHAYGWYRYRSFAGVEIVVRRGRDQRSSLGRIVQTACFRRSTWSITTVSRPPPLPERSSTSAPTPTLGFAVGRASGSHPQHGAGLQRHRRPTGRDLHARGGGPRRDGAAGEAGHAARPADPHEVRSEVRSHAVRSRDRSSPSSSPLTASRAERRQVPISGPDGFIGTVDFFWPVPATSSRSTARGTTDRSTRRIDEQRDDRLRVAGVHRGSLPIRPDDPRSALDHPRTGCSNRRVHVTCYTQFVRGTGAREGTGPRGARRSWRGLGRRRRTSSRGRSGRRCPPGR